MSFLNSEFPVDQEIREKRSNRILRAILQTNDGTKHQIVIRNFSSQGIGAMCREARFPVGMLVKILLPDEQTLAGTVCWRNGRNFGIKLEVGHDGTALAVTMQRLTMPSQREGEWEVNARHRVSLPNTTSVSKRII